jgi:hypothetical protein
MALIKEIVLDNGITVNYHRVVSVMNITNQSSIIEIASYTSKAKREEEKAAILAGTEMDVFIKAERPSIAYDKDLDVDGAYAYLKTLEKFAGYTDDLD